MRKEEAVRVSWIFELCAQKKKKKKKCVKKFSFSILHLVSSRLLTPQVFVFPSAVLEVRQSALMECGEKVNRVRDATVIILEVLQVDICFACAILALFNPRNLSPNSFYSART